MVLIVLNAIFLQHKPSAPFYSFMYCVQNSNLLDLTKGASMIKKCFEKCRIGMFFCKSGNFAEVKLLLVLYLATEPLSEPHVEMN